MSSKTKILILKKREAIYTALFAAFAVIFVALLVLMFRPGGNTAAPSPAKNLYAPGVYTAPVTLNGSVMNLEVRVDSDHIRSIGLVYLSEIAPTTFPVMEPALDSLETQICQKQSTQDIYYEASSQYTSQMLLNAIDSALKTARRAA